jgi:uncharacterized protein
MIRSRYLMISPRVYRDAAGRTTRMAYSARQARLFTMDDDTATRLAANDLSRVPEQEMARLVAMEAVVPEDENELTSVLARMREGSADPSVRRFTIMPTSYCNMACHYCGQEHRKQAVDQAKVDRIASRVEAAFADPATTSVSVTWFGGEPLLALRVIREMSARFVAAAARHGKHYSARMPTNGSLLTARTLQILHDECALRSLEVTIDGPQEVHDQRRIKRNGIGSFHRTVAALAGAVRAASVPDLVLSIRVNVDRDNEHTVADLIADLACFGFAAPRVELDLMPVHSWGNDVSAIELEARRYATLEASWIRLARSFGLNVPGMPSALKKTTCHATSRYGEIVDSEERIYACSEHPLVPKVRDTGVVARVSDLVGAAPRPVGAFDDWYDQVDDGKQQCGRCPLLPVCGGSCPKLWRDGYMPCPSARFNWEDRLDLAAQRLGYQQVGAG